MVSIHGTSIDFIQRFTGEKLSNQEMIEKFIDQSSLDIWIAKQYPDLSPEMYDAISLVAQPYFEHEDTPIYVVLWEDTLFITGHSDSSISFIRPTTLGNQQQIILDLPHAGTKAPSCVDGLLSEDVIADESICSNNPYTIWNQADVGVLEVSGSIWQNNKNITCGSAVLTNLIISNGNRAPAQEGRTNQVYNTHTYRGTSLYKASQQPNAAIKRALKKNHDLSISAAGACRAAAYTANSNHPIICLELHSYSAFSHEILDALFSPTIDGIKLTEFVPQNGGIGTKALLNHLRNSHDNKSYQDLVRPLVSVLDVSSTKDLDKYSTVTQSEMNAFVDPFIRTLYEADKSLLIDFDDWAQSFPDVYGAADNILDRLDAVIKKADDYIDAKNDNLIAQTINTVTIEYNRVLITPDEASNTQTNERDFYKRCQLVGVAFVAGLKNMQNLIQQHMRQDSNHHPQRYVKQAIANTKGEIVEFPNIK
ncbi:MAG: hypothetical protein AAGE84_06520 [Cyanobacteria bacterium P01_G01_bin.39]